MNIDFLFARPFRISASMTYCRHRVRSRGGSRFRSITICAPTFSSNRVNLKEFENPPGKLTALSLSITVSVELCVTCSFSPTCGNSKWVNLENSKMSRGKWLHCLYRLLYQLTYVSLVCFPSISTVCRWYDGHHIVLWSRESLFHIAQSWVFHLGSVTQGKYVQSTHRFYLRYYPFKRVKNLSMHSHNLAVNFQQNFYKINSREVSLMDSRVRLQQKSASLRIRGGGGCGYVIWN